MARQIEFILGLIHDFQITWEGVSATVSSIGRSYSLFDVGSISSPYWSLPKPGYLNLNIDASCSLRGTSLRGVFYDSFGQIAMASSKHYVCYVEVAVVEMLALLCGLKQVDGRSFSNFWVESDSLVLVNRII